MARLGFLGTGAIAEAMVRGLDGAGYDILVSERNAETAQRLARDVAGVSVATNDEVVARSDIVIACLMADTAERVLPDLPFRTGHKVISVMADMPRDRLAALVPDVSDLSLAIPLRSVATGGCPMPVWPDTGSVRAVFGERNPVIGVESEAALNAHFGACALSLPVMALLRTGIDWLAAQTGDRAAAETYVTAMFGAYFAAMRKDGSGEVDALMADLGTEGGLNDSLRNTMAQAGAPDALMGGLDGLRERLGLPAA